MRHNITSIKDLNSVLNDIIPSIKNPQNLYTGRDRSNFNQRPREILANWLICSVLNSELDEGVWTFGEDPMGGDGLIINRSSGTGLPTEHVFIPPPEPPANDSVEQLFLGAVEHKNKKGRKYATGKHLVIFVEGIERQWYPNNVSKRIRGQHAFDSVWAVGLQEADRDDYKYWVVCLDECPCPCFIVSVNVDKVEWLVEQIQ